MSVTALIADVTQRIAERSAPTRQAYLARMHAQRLQGPARGALGCTNLAHGFAASGEDKPELRAGHAPNIGIVTAYNDMLSAHRPFETYPALIRAIARGAGATAQVAGGVSAMCDGVTQGRAGMEMSLFSRDVIAQSTAIALSHDMFDGALMLGVCDKIVPGLVMGALSFGHLPVIFVPAGPMPSGIPNKEKAAVRNAFAQGLVGRDELLAAESASYHSPGTCTFYGTANSNQMLMEVMGLHMPGTAFVNPGTPLRDALTAAATERVVQITALGNHYTPLCDTLDEKAFVNALVGLSATGGSTNHTIHLIAMAHCAGIVLNWDDLDDISRHTPLLARVYPNGSADVNGFREAGGLSLLIRELLDAGLLHNDIRCVHGGDLRAQARDPYLDELQLKWREPPAEPIDNTIVRTVAEPFDSEGGLRKLEGNLGRCIVKTSAVAVEHRAITAPARVFDHQSAVQAAWERGELNGDVVCVVRGQGPVANGMPELHKLTPLLSVMQDRGQRVALLTDGRMSGASGKVLAAIHLTPEAANGGMIGQIRDGDLVRIDAEAGILTLLVDEQTRATRAVETGDLRGNRYGAGRELFVANRMHSNTAEQGASSLFVSEARDAH